MRRFWLKYIRREPPVVYRGEYGVLARLLAARRDGPDARLFRPHRGASVAVYPRWPKPAWFRFTAWTSRREPTGQVTRRTSRPCCRTVPLVLARSDRSKSGWSHSAVRRKSCASIAPAFRCAEFPALERRPPRRRPMAFRPGLPAGGKKRDRSGLARLRTICRPPSPGGIFRGRRRTAGKAAAESRRRAGAGGRVQLRRLSHQGQLRDLYHQCHVFVHPSQLMADQNQEGIPNSMLEAMATGLPVLATRHGGIPEAVSRKHRIVERGARRGRPVRKPGKNRERAGPLGTAGAPGSGRGSREFRAGIPDSTARSLLRRTPVTAAAAGVTFPWGAFRFCLDEAEVVPSRG